MLCDVLRFLMVVQEPHVTILISHRVRIPTPNLLTNRRMDMTKTHGFQHDVPDNNEDRYESYCWFEYPAIDPNGDNLGIVREIFPPCQRNNIYGDLMETEVRSKAYSRYNELVRNYGSANVTIEMIGD